MSAEYECPECDWTGDYNSLGYLCDVAQRVGTGALMPAGECPVCGALIECTDDDIPEYTLDACAEVMIRRGWLVVKGSM